MKNKSTTVIGIPVDKVYKVEELLGRKLATSQTPIVKIRVPTERIAEIRQAIKS